MWIVCRYQKINSAFDEINNLLIFITFISIDDIVNRMIRSRSSFYTEFIEDIIHFTIFYTGLRVFIVIKLVC